MTALLLRPETADFPGWIPVNISNYLLHTVQGVPIRELARQRGCHASTVLRQVRRIESRRDDPLVDGGLTRLGQEICGETETGPQPTDAQLEEAAIRVLRRLCESGAVLAVAPDMANAIVMRGVDGGAAARTAVVETNIAQAMALLDWLDWSVAGSGAVQRYRVSASGRAALGRLLAATENRARAESEGGFAEAQATFGAPFGADSAIDAAVARHSRYVTTDTPLVALSRRRDKDGNRFLDADMVRAGEHLREDYELARLGAESEQDLLRMLNGGRAAPGAVQPQAAVRARDRLAAALGDLGPGLADVALRCCCCLEGLERTEKLMGWSARSGKIVLRIALQRLSRHYRDAAQQGSEMIG